MAAAAHHFTELFRAVHASLVESRSLQPEPGEKLDPDTTIYCRVCLVIALERLSLLTRRYTALPEFKDPTRGTPIISDAGFGAAGAAVADQLDLCREAIGPAAARIAATVREWLDKKHPDNARLLGVQADGAVRLLKRQRKAVPA